MRDDGDAIRITRDGSGFLLETELAVPRPREDIFPFFANAENLEAITPSRLRFRILTPTPIAMRAGARIDYTLSIRGVPVRWQTEITAWDPPRRFVDEQRAGPYRWWVHEHVFRADGNCTIIGDRVRYGVPGGSLVHRLLVGPDVRHIFAHRRQTLLALFADERSPVEPATGVPAAG